MIGRIRYWVRAVFLRGRVEREMRDEVDGHLDRAIERLVRRGMSVEEARAAAFREFGNVEYVKEPARDARGGRGIEALLQDARFGLRRFTKTPLATLVMVLILALGIGANSAMFTWLRTVTTMPAPGIPRDGDVVRIRGYTEREDSRNTAQRTITLPEFEAYAVRTEVFAQVAGWTRTQLTVDVPPEVPGIMSPVTFVEGDYFGVLGVRPVVGGGLGPVRDAGTGGGPITVLSHALWTEHLGASPEAVGKVIRINGVPVTIVGVAPPRFAGTETSDPARGVWLPMASRALILRGDVTPFSDPEEGAGAAATNLAPVGSEISDPRLALVARLHRGVSIDAATAVVQTIAGPFIDRLPDAREREGGSVDVVPLLATNSIRGRERSLRDDYATLFAPITLLILSSPARM